MIRLFLNLIFYIVVCCIIGYVCLGFVDIIFDLISLRFSPWFPKEHTCYIDWDILKDFYYFLGFLDYASIGLPEIVDVNLKDENLSLFDAIFFLSWIYLGIVENLHNILYSIFGFSVEANTLNLDSLFLLLDLDVNFELASLFANYTDIIFLDNVNGLDRYFSNLRNQGWSRDAWEMGNLQILYLQNLARDSFHCAEYMTTITDIERNKLFLDFWSKEKTFFDQKSKIFFYWDSDTFEDFYDSHNINALDEITQFTLHHDSFSFFYKLVKQVDRVFFDNFYLYFYFKDNNILFRVNRMAISDIFHKNIIWGIVDVNRYPYNFVWDYNTNNIIGTDFFFNYSNLWKYYESIGKPKRNDDDNEDEEEYETIDNFDEEFLSYNFLLSEFLPFVNYEYLDTDSGGVLLDSLFFRNYGFHQEFEELFWSSHNTSLEWVPGLYEYNSPRWGKSSEKGIWKWKKKLFVKPGGSAELSLDAISCNDSLEGLNREEPWTRKKRKKMISRRLSKKTKLFKRNNVFRKFKYLRRWISSKFSTEEDLEFDDETW